MKYVRRLMLAIAFIVLIPKAYAQHGPRPGFGPAGGAPPLAMIVLDATLHASLALDASQEAAWTALATHAQSLGSQMDTARAVLASLILSEAAKNSPDLVAIEAARASADQANETAMLDLAAQAVTLYSALTEEQKAKVVGAWQSVQKRATAAPSARAG